MNTAVLMIDMMNVYRAADGERDALGWPPIWRLEETVEQCHAMLSAARRQKLPVLYSRGERSAGGAAGDNPRLKALLSARGSRLPPLEAQTDAWKGQIMDDLRPAGTDFVLPKTRNSFFDFTELDPLLRNLGVDRLVIAGLQTNVCVEATARSGLAHNFAVAVAEDAVSTDGPALHWASLNSMRVLYVEVAPWRELLALDAPWTRAFDTPNYGRDPSYWDETTQRSDPANVT